MTTTVNVGIGQTYPTHELHVRSTDTETMRLEGAGSFGSLSRLNFGDSDYVYIDEPVDDDMRLYASDIEIAGRTTVTGNLTVTGTLSKGGGSFKIDHPLDPRNKYLYHSFVESPDMMNVYNGNVQLDEKGEAWITLPEWFEAVNREFRYQLTPLGAASPSLFIDVEVKDNRFKIAGGEPFTRVSWQVTGIRKDPFAEANRIPLEVMKSPEERGFYLHPGAYGLSDEFRIGYRPEDRKSEIERAAKGNP